MKTLLFCEYSMVFFTLTEAVDPKNFQCDKDSPLGGDTYSDSSPQVNMIHIFCGQIKQQDFTATQEVPTQCVQRQQSR